MGQASPCSSGLFFGCPHTALPNHKKFLKNKKTRLLPLENLNPKQPPSKLCRLDTVCTRGACGVKRLDLKTLQVSNQIQFMHIVIGLRN